MSSVPSYALCCRNSRARLSTFCLLNPHTRHRHCSLQIYPFCTYAAIFCRQLSALLYPLHLYQTAHHQQILHHRTYTVSALMYCRRHPTQRHIRTAHYPALRLEAHRYNTAIRPQAVPAPLSQFLSAYTDS